MALDTFLQGLGATHLFSLDGAANIADDLGDSVDPTEIDNLAGTSFVANTICQGVTQSLESVSAFPLFGAANDGAEFDNRLDINGSNGAGNDSSTFNYVTGTRTLHLWFQQLDPIDTPTCIYEQGGGVNNFAFVVGLARAITFQAADSGQPFLIAQSNFQAEQNRPYFIAGIWEHESQHAGAGNRVLNYVNGVFQEEATNTGTAAFPGHSGDIVLGNTLTSLQSYNGSTQVLATRAKRCSWLGMYNNVSLTEANLREIFERSTLADVTIAADTVANQQAALDVLTGNSYAGTNCAIRIIQATDATNYRLFVDNILFTEDPNLRDIAIQYVGPNTLTLENANGSNVVEISTPAELDQDGITVLAGGGSINLVEDTVRVNTVADQTNITANKIVLEQAGTYVFTNVIVGEYENVSGGVVNLTSDTALPIVTNTGAGSVTNLLDGAFAFQNVDSWIVYPTQADADANTNALGNGLGTDTFPFAFNGTDTYFFRLTASGETVFQENTPLTAGTTIIDLGATALLLAINEKLGPQIKIG